MNKSLCLAAVIIVIAASGCNDQRFKKEKDGTEYKIIRASNGKLAVAGDYMEINTLAKYKDSVLYSSMDYSTPRFIPYDTVQMPPYFREVHEGDSLVIRQSTDSILKHGPGAPWMQRGEFITQSFKIVKLFPNKAAADSAAGPFEATAKIISSKKAEEAIEKEIAKDTALVRKDDAEIKDYMVKNHLAGTKTAWGTYVILDSAGSGATLSPNDIAVVNYTGRTFNDSTFDSNTDKKFNHEQPLYIDMNDYSVIIPGWIDGLKQMKKGSKGKLIIPSYLGYGANGRPPKIGPNENLVFDIEVTDVVGQHQYQEEMKRQQMQMQLQREIMQEQMQKKLGESQKKQSPEKKK
jgi:FKBP-type peptidyl-prolyl cis-trans isomerase